MTAPAVRGPLRKGMRILDGDRTPCVVAGFHRERTWSFRRSTVKVFVIATYADDTSRFLPLGSVVVDGSEGSDA